MKSRDELLAELERWGAMAKDWDRAVSVFDAVADSESAVLAVIAEAQYQAHLNVLRCAKELSETIEE